MFDHLQFYDTEYVQTDWMFPKWPVQADKKKT